MKSTKEPWVGVVIYNDRGEVCVVQKNKHTDAEKSLSIPGGRFELEEEFSEEQAKKVAESEAQEETGLKIENIELIIDSGNIFGGDKERMGMLFIAHVKGAQTPEPIDRKEIAEAKWVPLSEVELDDLPMHERFRELLERVRMKIGERLHERYVGLRK